MTSGYERPDVLMTVTPRVRLGCGRVMYVRISSDQGRIVEVIACVSGESGTCEGALVEAVCRLASGWLQAGGTVEDVSRAIIGIRCPQPVIGRHLSCMDALGKGLVTHE